ncbi:MAG: helix-turn-helix transcriptional regulator [Clostridia bacterium]|nr:helix-turn-helix transcriptional regulator [Clostridia bacterium]
MKKESLIISQCYFENWPNDNPFSIQQITNVSRTNRKVERKYSESYALEYIISGEIEVNEGGVVTVASAGDTLLLRRHTPHFYNDAINKNVRAIHTTFCGSMCDLLYDNYGLSARVVYKGVDISKQLKAMLDFSIKNKDINEQTAYCSGVIAEIFYKLYLSLVGDETQISGTVAYAKVVIDRHIEKFSSNEELAEFLKCSVSTFTKNFKKKYGITPIEYQKQKKIESAKQLLIDGKLSVKEIANHLGFCDAAYFSAYFKKYTGLTPKEYKKGEKNEKE